MNKLIYLFILMPFWMNAQIVNIPDSNFKAKLLQADVTNEIAYGNNSFIKIDSNNNGEIEVSEALQVTKLFVNLSSIIDIEGIQAFTNLTQLNCSENGITFLDLNSLLGLTYLNCSNNVLTSIDVSQNTNLVELYCDHNQISVLDVQSNVNLQRIDCSVNVNISSLNLSNNSSLTFLDCSGNNLLSVLDLTQNTNLIHLSCTGNQMTMLDLSQNQNLEVLSCFNNQISNLNVSSCLNLKILECYDNELISLDVSQNVMLEELHCSTNQLTSLNVSQNTLLNTLICGANQISTIDLSSNLALVNLDCEINQITTIDTSQNTLLVSFGCGNNLISSLDLTNNTLLTSIACDNNLISAMDLSTNLLLGTLNCSHNLLTTLDISPLENLTNLYCGYNNLTSLFLKNGNATTIVQFNENPNLNYICCNEEDIIAYQLSATAYGYACTVNSYCSFTPGGNYNTITGSTTFDSQNNGCDTNDTFQPNIKIHINDGTNQGATFTNSTANYNFYTQVGSFTISPDIENPSWFTPSPTSVTIPFANNNNNTTIQNFCIAPNGVHPDVEVVIAPITPARPGFDAIYKIVYKNKGNQALSGNIVFNYNDNILDFVTASILPDAQNLGILNWNYQNLLPFENRSFYVTLNVNSPQEIPAVNINDILNFQVAITSLNGDEITEDNSFSYNQTVVGSFDPNDITCIEGEVAPPSEIGDYLHYIINFENTGTAEAENIVVNVDVDESKFDINSMQLLNASHAVDARVKGNKAEFIFQEIWLDTGGHGNVLLKIRTKNNLLEGESVTKQANIYFDYNFPIETNMAHTTFEILSSGNFEVDESITVFPNPTTSIINVSSDNHIQLVQLYDLQGRLLQTQIIDAAATKLDMSNKTNGIYFLKITTENGVKVEKISKEK